MTKHFIWVLIVSLFIVSCSNKANKNAQAEKLVKSLERENATLIALNNEREAELTELKLKNENLTNTYVPIDRLDGCIREVSQLLSDKKQLAKFMIDRYALESGAILWQLVYDSWGYDKSSWYKPDNFALLLRNTDRSAESVRGFFSERDKERIYSLFEGSSMYQNSGLSALAEGLLFTYEEFQKNPDFLIKMESVLYSEPDYEEIEEYSEAPDSELEDILSDERYMDTRNDSYLGHRIFYVNSFWARRHHEGNSEAVYELIKEAHERLRLRPDVEWDEEYSSIGDENYDEYNAEYDDEGESEYATKSFADYNCSSTDFGQFVINRFKLKSKSIFHVLIASASTVIGPDDDNLGSSELCLIELWRYISRYPSIIKHFFTEENRESIYGLFSNNSIYQSSGLSVMAEGLLQAYEEFEEQQDVLEKFHEHAYEEYSNYWTFLDNYPDFISEEMKRIMADERCPKENGDITTDCEYRCWYVYRFWVRRYHESNSEVVYELIKEMHERLGPQE